MIEIDKRKIQDALDDLAKKKTYSTRMHYGFKKGIEFTLSQVNENELSPPVRESLSEEDIEKLAYEKFPREINDPYNPQDDDAKEYRDIWINGYKSSLNSL